MRRSGVSQFVRVHHLVVNFLLATDVAQELMVPDREVSPEEVHDEIIRCLTTCCEVGDLGIDELVKFVDVVVDGPHLLGQVLESLTDVVGCRVGFDSEAKQEDLQVSRARWDVGVCYPELIVFVRHPFLGGFSERTTEELVHHVGVLRVPNLLVGIGRGVVSDVLEGQEAVRRDEAAGHAHGVWHIQDVVPVK